MATAFEKAYQANTQLITEARRYSTSTSPAGKLASGTQSDEGCIVRTTPQSSTPKSHK